MNIFDETTDFVFKNTAVTLGKFDGMHIGHRQLITRVLDEKKQYGYETILFSFDTSKMTGGKSITTKNERNLLCDEYGIDHVIYYPVNQETMSIEPEEFIEKILVGKLNVKLVVTGEDFRFGKNRRGDIGMLFQYSEKYGYELSVQKSVTLEGVRASSTRIKEYLQSGDVENAGKMLGYHYFILGDVERGQQIGRTIDARTANIIPGQDKMIPLSGVYKTAIYIDGIKYKSITNIGLCPTVRENGEITVETHIFDFDENVYGKSVKIEFEKFIRKEKKFSNIDELKNQIALDILSANL